nr:twin-arginine translocation signal domain-containing protein [Actinomycetes bacterium]
MVENTENSGLSRRRLLQAAGVAGVLGAAAAGSSSASATPRSVPRQPFKPRGRLKRR